MARNALLRAMPNPVSEWRFATDFPGNDLGAQINAAIADLPVTGGVVYVPSGSSPIYTPIDYGTRSRVTLRGLPSLSHVDAAPIEPTAVFLESYVDSAPVVTIGDPNGNVSRGCGIDGIRIEQKVATSHPVILVNNSTWGVLRHTMVSAYNGGGYGGYAAEGIRFGDGAKPSHGWHLEHVVCQFCQDGLVLNKAHGTAIYGGILYRCERGMVVGPSAPSTGVRLLGGDIEANLVAVELAQAYNFSCHGTYMETIYANDPGPTYLFKIGTQGDVVGVTLAGVYFQNGGGSVAGGHYGILLRKCYGLCVVGGYATSGLNRLFVHDAGSSVQGVAVYGSRVACDLTDNYDGFVAVIGHDSNQRVILPNLPASDPGSVGALWRDSNGFVKASG